MNADNYTMFTTKAYREDQWTTHRLLTWTAKHFAKQQIQSSRLAAELLLAHVLKTTRLKLYTDSERPTSIAERTNLRKLVIRAARHEPVQYLTGHAPFMTMMLQVNPSVLIPRPSTETIVEHVLQREDHSSNRNITIGDIGTGSGAIAVALAKYLKGCRVIATDIHADALEVAGQNAQAIDVDQRISFHQGNLLLAIPEGQKLDYLVSNPPYISDPEWQQVAPNIKDFEPHHALRGGIDGLNIIRPLLAMARNYMKDTAQLVLEIAASQAKQVLELANQTPGLTPTQILNDHEGLPRVLVANAT